MVLVRSMLSDSAFICTKSPVDFSYSSWFPNWNRWNTGQVEFEVSSPHFDRVPRQPFNDSQLLAHSKCDASAEITISTPSFDNPSKLLS